MGDVRDILRGSVMNDVMSQSHPAPDGRHVHSPSASDPWRWTEYKSKYRPFSQYSYTAGSWHRNEPLDTTDGPSSWYAEVAERIHKAEEYKTRSRSSGIGETDYPSERNRLIWSNSISALTLHDTVDSAAGHRRQKSRFHSLGPAFPLPKDGKPSSANSTGGAANKSSGKPRTSRSVSRRRAADGGKAPAQGTSPTKTATPMRAPLKTPTKKHEEAKESAKDSKPRAVVKPTPAKEDKAAKHDEKKWIKPAVANETIEKEKDKSPIGPKEMKETKPATVTPPTQTTAVKTVDVKSPPVKQDESKATGLSAEDTPVTKEEQLDMKNKETVHLPQQQTKDAGQAKASVSQTAVPSAKIQEPTVPPTPPTAATDLTATTAHIPAKPGAEVEKQRLVSLPSPAATAPSVAPISASVPAVAGTPSPAVVPTTAAPVAAPIDPMAQSFIDTTTIGGGLKASPKPGDFSFAGSRLDEYWAQGK